MKHVTLLLAAALALPAVEAPAEDLTAGMITISNLWARATPKGATVGAAYLTLSNKGTNADRLVGVSSPGAGSVELHEMSMKNGVMSMREVAGGVEIKPGQTVVLKPNAYHIMLMDLKQPLVKGEHLMGTLEFANAGKVDVDFPIQAIGARGPGESKAGNE